MSRAFVKESDDEQSEGDLPERPLGAHPNYVTPRGLALLQSRLRELQVQRDQLKAEDESLARQKLPEVKRDIRYFSAQIDRAVIVDPLAQPHDEVRFGARVVIRGEDAQCHEFHIVGDDEADVAASRISWASPLAKAMIGARAGDTVKWERPAGTAEFEIVAVHYDAEPAPR